MIILVLVQRMEEKCRRNYLKWEINILGNINAKGKDILTKIGARGKERQK